VVIETDVPPGAEHRDVVLAHDLAHRARGDVEMRRDILDGR
jgi:hypothetical protein